MERWEAGASAVLPWTCHCTGEPSRVSHRGLPVASFIPRPSRPFDTPCCDGCIRASEVQSSHEELFLGQPPEHCSVEDAGDTLPPLAPPLAPLRGTASTGCIFALRELFEEFEARQNQHTEECVRTLLEMQSMEVKTAFEQTFLKLSGKLRPRAETDRAASPTRAGSPGRSCSPARHSALATHVVSGETDDAEKVKSKARGKVMFADGLAQLENKNQKAETEQRAAGSARMSLTSSIMATKWVQNAAAPFGQGTEWMRKQLSGLSRFNSFEDNGVGLTNYPALRRQRTQEWSTGMKGLIYRKVKSPAFSYLVAAAIFCDVVFVGYATDLSMDRARNSPEMDQPAWVRDVELSFSALFVCELLLRLVIFRMDYFLGEDWKWNICDALLVILSTVGDLMGPHSGAFGLLRGLRVARFVRAVRVSHTFSSLRMMFCCLFNSLSVLWWALVLLVLVLFFFTVIFMEAASGYLREASRLGSCNPELEILAMALPADEVCSGLRRYYGSFSTTLISLFMAVTGGLDWETLEAPIKHISPAYAWCFHLFIFFMMFGVFNVLIGVFAERAFKSSSLDKDLLMHAAQEKRDMFIREGCEIFNALDTECEGAISQDSFVDCMKNKTVFSYLQMHQLDWLDPEMFFDMLDEDKSGKVDLKELIMGMIRYGGHAKAVDVMLLQQNTKRLESMLASSLTQLNVKLGLLGIGSGGKHAPSPVQAA